MSADVFFGDVPKRCDDELEEERLGGGRERYIDRSGLRAAKRRYRWYLTGDKGQFGDKEKKLKREEKGRSAQKKETKDNRVLRRRIFERTKEKGGKPKRQRSPPPGGESLAASSRYLEKDVERVGDVGTLAR